MVYYFDNIYLLSALGLFLLALILYLKFAKKKSAFYLFFFIIMYVYLCYVVYLTQFPIYATEGMKIAFGGQNVWREMNLVPLKSIIINFSVDSVLNILLTIPFGFALPFLFKITWRNTTLAGICIGTLIELGQLISALIVGFTIRHINIDDVILNLAGTIIGYVVFLIFKKVFNWHYGELLGN